MTIQTKQFISDGRVAEISSKGNQEKWQAEGRWYKLDQFGYEGLAETVISRLLERSSIETDTPFRFVRYRIERMHVHGRDRNGCSSADFLQPEESIVTLAHLFRRAGSPLKQRLERLPSDRRRIMALAEETAELTGLQVFPQYLTLLFEVDALFLNDDRHLNNIAVLEKNGRFDYCPIFDNGAGLLSNVQMAPMDIDPAALIRSAKARPFGITFNRQMMQARRLYGSQLHLPAIREDDILRELDGPLAYYAVRDRDLITDRVCGTILTRQKAHFRA
ncbi:MAG: hypothetical protein J5949_05245 [Oscillospiraceae bacterium]|nr:hypothetical protein [Oscillospiraceae bacterium]